MNNLGLIALEENRYDLAEDFLRRAETIEQSNAKTHFLLAKALLGKGDHRAAQIEAARAINLRPNQPEFRELQAQLAQQSP